jgi:hypothetical protein
MKIYNVMRYHLDLITITEIWKHNKISNPYEILGLKAF